MSCYDLVTKLKYTSGFKEYGDFFLLKQLKFNINKCGSLFLSTCYANHLIFAKVSTNSLNV